ncbi:MAG: hypothetical protein MUC88_15570 [Planctomycetes bacterium]|jgi:hypothetical protein|nr:hypothetical protein [Planctomycetota bacterium]
MDRGNHAFSFGRPGGISAAALVLATLFVTALTAACSQAAHVSTNADGVLLIDGRKVLPIGFTSGPPPEGRTPDGRPAFEEIRAAGGTFFRTGLMGSSSWNEATIAQEQVWMDAAARYGLYCWPRLEKLSSLEEGDTRKEALLRSVLTRFRHHPGLLLWKNVDEPFWGKVPPEPMIRAYQVIKEVDPCHPVGLTQAPRGTVADLQPYNAAADILLLDIYPIGYPPGLHSLGANKEISMVGDYTRFIKEVADGKPVWMVLQIAWSGVLNPGKTLRFPTFPQERFMTYQALINGARGIIYFGGSLKPAMTPADAELGWNWTFWRRVLRPVVEEIGTSSPLAPALVAPDSRLPIQVEGAHDVEFCVREVSGDVYLLACKREGQTVEVKFTGLPFWAATGTVLYESPRQVRAKAGVFKDWFAPFDVHVYHFRRPDPAPEAR